MNDVLETAALWFLGAVAVATVGGVGIALLIRRSKDNGQNQGGELPEDDTEEERVPTHAGMLRAPAPGFRDIREIGDPTSPAPISFEEAREYLRQAAWDLVAGSSIDVDEVHFLEPPIRLLVSGQVMAYGRGGEEFLLPVQREPAYRAQFGFHAAHGQPAFKSPVEVTVFQACGNRLRLTNDDTNSEDGRVQFELYHPDLERLPFSEVAFHGWSEKQELVTA